MTETTRIALRRRTLIAAVAWLGAGLAGLGPVAAAGVDEDVWPDIAKEIFGTALPVETTDKVVLDAPYRAEDAAIVPITMTIPADIVPRTRKLTLIVDKNPAPVVAAFEFGEAAGIGTRTISTRVRVDMYSNVRAVVELDDGSRYMATKFVKAAGGCSAPALKDMDAALAGIGKMKLRSLPEAPAASPLVREAQVMVRHPNYSGMQMNQLTGLYIPAKYVEFMEIRKGAALVFRMQGGISLSEDPNIRFTYAPGIAGDLSVLARDTDGNSYTTSATPTGS